MKGKIRLIVIGLMLITLLVPLAGALTAWADENNHGAIVKFQGIVESRPEGTTLGPWVIDGRTVQVVESTIINEAQGTATVGASVVVLAKRLAGGDLEAMLIRVKDPATPSDTVEIKGFILELGDDYLVVNGLTITWTQSTHIEGTLEVGAFVEIEARLTPSGYVAVTIEVKAHANDRIVEFEGIIERMGDSTWVVSGREIMVNADTEIEGSPEIGARVKVRALVLPDGTFLALKIKVKTSESVKVRFTGVIESLPPDLLGEWVIGGRTVLVTADTKIMGTPELGAEARVEALIQADGTLLATKIKIENGGPEEVEFSGVIESLPPTKSLFGPWTIGGRTVIVTPETDIEGTPALGKEAEVEAMGLRGRLLAIRIEISENPAPPGPPTPIVDPKDGPVIAHLVPVVGSGCPEDAQGVAVFNYRPGTDSFEVQLNAIGLEPNTQYELYVAIHGVELVATLGTFSTDRMGHGVLHVWVDDIGEFNVVNVGFPGVSGSRQLTSWGEDGGRLIQTPVGPTRTPWPTRTMMPTGTPRPTRTMMPTTTPRPTRTMMPTRTPRPTRTKMRKKI